MLLHRYILPSRTLRDKGCLIMVPLIRLPLLNDPEQIFILISASNPVLFSAPNVCRTLGRVAHPGLKSTEILRREVTFTPTRCGCSLCDLYTPRSCDCTISIYIDAPRASTFFSDCKPVHLSMWTPCAFRCIYRFPHFGQCSKPFACACVEGASSSPSPIIPATASFSADATRI